MRYLLLVTLCLSNLYPLACSSVDVDSRKKAQEVWMKHEHVVHTAAEGIAVDFQAFEQACAFFLEVAGIEIPGDGSYIAPWHPSPETPSAIPVIREWYTINKDRLYWYPETEKVILRPSAEKTE